jgi:hypothetical protein
LQTFCIDLRNRPSSQKRQVACGKNGTSGAILGKRRLLGERILAVAGIWRSDDIDEAPRSEIND